MKNSNAPKKLSVTKSVITNFSNEKSIQETILVTWKANQETILVTWQVIR